jgi:GT2 family glycosyltransferase
MDLSLVILNYKTAGLTKQCVKTVDLHKPSCAYEIIVVDNASGDGVARRLGEAFPHVRVIESPRNVGYAAGNNIGIRASCGRYVLILNPDITVGPGSIDAMVAFMDAHPDVGIMGPKLVHPDGSLDVSCYRFPEPLTPLYRRTPLGKLPAGRLAIDRYLMSEYDRRETRDVDWLLGAVLMVRRSALEKIGPLDERYFLYFEDTDWCRRFLAAGYRVVFHPGATMVHYHERLSAKGSWATGLLRRSTRVHVASWIKYMKKWRNAASDVPSA